MSYGNWLAIRLVRHTENQKKLTIKSKKYRNIGIHSVSYLFLLIFFK